jgi:hypothetical protein
MKDKELQELFAAKRTTEANRRRQEELAAMIGHKSGKGKIRPLWWFISSAAAAVFAAVLLVRPFFSSTEEMPIIAQANPTTVIAAEPDATNEAPALFLQSPTVAPARPERRQREVSSLEVAVEQFLAESNERLGQDIPKEESFVEEAFKEPPLETAAPVRRRLTNNLACVKGCARPKSSTQERTMQWNTQQEAQGVTLFAMN